MPIIQIIPLIPNEPPNKQHPPPPQQLGGRQEPCKQPSRGPPLPLPPHHGRGAQGLSLWPQAPPGGEKAIRKLNVSRNIRVRLDHAWVIRSLFGIVYDRRCLLEDPMSFLEDPRSILEAS